MCFPSSFTRWQQVPRVANFRFYQSINQSINPGRGPRSRCYLRPCVGPKALLLEAKEAAPSVWGVMENYFRNLKKKFHANSALWCSLKWETYSWQRLYTLCIRNLGQFGLNPEHETAIDDSGAAPANPRRLATLQIRVARNLVFLQSDEKSEDRFSSNWILLRVLIDRESKRNGHANYHHYCVVVY